MSKFLFVYRNNADMEQQEMSPEQMQEVMQAWGAWFQKLGSAVIDGGDGLLPTGKQVRGDTVTDGPFIEAKELVGGFSIIAADNYDQAALHAKGCPIIAHGGAVEIREFAGFGDQM